jgi:cobalt/nickel transport system ATP-binding protein
LAELRTGPGPELPAEATRLPEPEVFACHGVGYRYLDRFTALDGVDVEVARAERVVLLGANGCGKSTLLKVLDALIFPTSGTVHAFGRELTEDTAEDPAFVEDFRSRVGFVFQNSDAQLFSPTVTEEIAFGCLQLGLDREETRTRVADVLDLLGIADLADRAPFQLSGGQKKRVAIASVLAMNPEVLLFDEPTAGLDPRTRHGVVELLGELGATGRTLLLATHDLDAAALLADRALVLGEDHTLVRDAAVADVLADRDLLVRVNLVHPRDPR